MRVNNFDTQQNIDENTECYCVTRTISFFHDLI